MSAFRPTIDSIAARAGRLPGPSRVMRAYRARVGGARTVAHLRYGSLALWTVAILTSALSQHASIDNSVRDLAYGMALAASDKDLVYRSWSSGLGGVYAPIDLIEPNPYLDADRRNIETSIGDMTLINPAYMTRSVYEMGFNLTGIRGGVTSLNPIRPENAPDDWERRALEAFETDPTISTVSEVSHFDGEPYFRLIRPFFVEESCLTCHAQQGYSLGDVRGAISVAVPIYSIEDRLAQSRQTMWASHAFVWLLGGMGIVAAFGFIGSTVRDSERALAQATEANRAKSLFLASMSHDLRTPLNAILGMSEAMQLEMFGPHIQAKYRDYSGDIRKAGGELLAMVDNVLDLSKIEAGRVEPNPETFAVDAELLHIASMVEDTVARASQTLAIDLDRAFTHLHADRQMVDQMVSNLLVNAIKFTPAGGTITLRSRRQADGTGLIAVEDTGPGMTAADAEKATEPFAQMQVSTNADYRTGIGLGLSIVSRLIALHGGTVEIDSAVGRGTAVALRFPAEAVPPPAEPAADGDRLL